MRGRGCEVGVEKHNQRKKRKAKLDFFIPSTSFLRSFPSSLSLSVSACLLPLLPPALSIWAPPAAASAGEGPTTPRARSGTRRCIHRSRPPPTPSPGSTRRPPRRRSPPRRPGRGPCWYEQSDEMRNVATRAEPFLSSQKRERASERRRATTVVRRLQPFFPRLAEPRSAPRLASFRSAEDAEVSIAVPDAVGEARRGQERGE